MGRIAQYVKCDDNSLCENFLILFRQAFLKNAVFGHCNQFFNIFREIYQRRLFFPHAKTRFKIQTRPKKSFSNISFKTDADFIQKYAWLIPLKSHFDTDPKNTSYTFHHKRNKSIKHRLIPHKKLFDINCLSHRKAIIYRVWLLIVLHFITIIGKTQSTYKKSFPLFSARLW